MSEMITVRGMKDLMGPEMVVRNYLVRVASRVFEKYGFNPLDTPVMEKWKTLSAKGGDEVESETFKFRDKGKREVGLRYDLTVPLARFVSSNTSLPQPFKRYAIGKAWRYDRPQAGRFREFEQADVDIVGISSSSADAQVVLVALEFLKRVFKDNYVIRINNRKVLKGLVQVAGIPESQAYEVFRGIDKLEKIGRRGVLIELKERGINRNSIDFLLEAIQTKGTGKEALNKFRSLLGDSEIGIKGVDELTLMAEIFEESRVTDKVQFDMSLARGLDYYTGPIFEGNFLGISNIGSILGGGRYDHLIEKFGGPSTPATGISLGIGRMIDLILEYNPSKGRRKVDFVYIAPLEPDLIPRAMSIQYNLVRENFDCDVDLMGRSIKKVFPKAEKMKARLVILVGREYLKQGQVNIRDMRKKESEPVYLEDVVRTVGGILRPQSKKWRN